MANTPTTHYNTEANQRDFTSICALGVLPSLPLVKDFMYIMIISDASNLASILYISGIYPHRLYRITDIQRSLDKWVE